MNNLLRFRWLLAAAAIVTLSGCRAERAFSNLVSSMGELVEILSSVRDAETAKAVIETLDEQFEEVEVAYAGYISITDKRMRKSASEYLGEKFRDYKTKTTAEIARLERTRGLPTEFWKVVCGRLLTLYKLDAYLTGTSGVFMRIESIEEFVKKHGHEKLITLDLKGALGPAGSEARVKVKKIAPKAAILPQTTENGLRLLVAPVEDYRQFLSALDFGSVLFEDAGRRAIELDVDLEKLKPKRDPTASSGQPTAPQISDEERERRRIEQMQAFQQKMEEERKKREPNPDSPDYFDKLAEMMTSSIPTEKSKALDLLIAADPSKASAELRGKIARNFKQIAETGSMIDKPKAVRGLVVWGGQFSVPILITILESGDRFLASDVIRALGDLKDPRGVGPVAARLKDFRYRDAAAAALRSIGPPAEDALIEIAPTTDPQLCLLAVNLLGEVGTPKCFEVLRMGLKSRNPEVRLASKNAMAKINGRKTAGKPADSSN